MPAASISRHYKNIELDISPYDPWEGIEVRAHGSPDAGTPLVQALRTELANQPDFYAYEPGVIQEGQDAKGAYIGFTIPPLDTLHVGSEPQKTSPEKVMREIAAALEVVEQQLNIEPKAQTKDEPPSVDVGDDKKVLVNTHRMRGDAEITPRHDAVSHYHITAHKGKASTVTR